MTDLRLRAVSIGNERLKDDFVVMLEHRAVGRIRLAGERVGHGVAWDWAITIPLPMPAWTHGSSDSLDQAKAHFRAALDRFLAGLTDRDIAHWHRVADARGR